MEGIGEVDRREGIEEGEVDFEKGRGGIRREERES